MPSASLIRTEHSASHTRGVLFVAGASFHTIERGWHDNQVNESCIPAGTYKVTPLPRSASGKYRNVFLLHDVPGRGGILIHNGNLASHSRGCIILGGRAGTLSGQPAVLNSKSAMQILNSLVSHFELTIVGGQYD